MKRNRKKNVSDVVDSFVQAVSQIAEDYGLQGEQGETAEDKAEYVLSGAGTEVRAWYDGAEQVYGFDKVDGAGAKTFENMDDFVITLSNYAYVTLNFLPVANMIADAYADDTSRVLGEGRIIGSAESGYHITYSIQEEESRIFMVNDAVEDEDGTIFYHAGEYECQKDEETGKTKLSKELQGIDFGINEDGIYPLDWAADEENTETESTEDVESDESVEGSVESTEIDGSAVTDDTVEPTTEDSTEEDSTEEDNTEKDADDLTEDPMSAFVVPDIAETDSYEESGSNEDTLLTEDDGVSEEFETPESDPADDVEAFEEKAVTESAVEEEYSKESNSEETTTKVAAETAEELISGESDKFSAEGDIITFDNGNTSIEFKYSAGELILDKGLNGLFVLRDSKVVGTATELSEQYDDLYSVVDELLQDESLWQIDNPVLADIVAEYGGSVVGDALHISDSVYSVATDDETLMINGIIIPSVQDFADRFMLMTPDQIDDTSAETIDAVEETTEPTDEPLTNNQEENQMIDQNMADKLLAYVCKQTVKNLLDSYHSDMYTEDYTKTLFQGYLNEEMDSTNPLFKALIKECITKNTEDPYLGEFTSEVLAHIGGA